MDEYLYKGSGVTINDTSGTSYTQKWLFETAQKSKNIFILILDVIPYFRLQVAKTSTLSLPHVV